jgi:tetratricopeptide (TPR) repeat protein
LIKGLPVAAIDRVHVADNLFAAGEYLLANEIYEQVDRRSVSSDESGWVEFQLANCSRRLGRLDDAKKRYRRVVADPTLGWLQDMAKWRLDAIDEREHLVKDHARLEAAIKQYSEAPRAATKP